MLSRGHAPCAAPGNRGMLRGMERRAEDERNPVTIVETAAMAAAIERWAGDLALAEEPARFLVALEEGAP